MVRISQRDGLGSANQARRDRTSGTNGTVGVPAVGQRGGMQGRGSGGSPCEGARSGVWVCCATLSWFHGRTGGAGEVLVTFSNCELLSADDRIGGWEFAPPTTLRAIFGSGDDRNHSFIENLGPTAAEQKKMETKDLPPGLPSGEGAVQSPSPEEQSQSSLGHPS